MQTGLHFENGKVYICRMDGQRITEEEPVQYKGSWADYITEILNQDKEHKGSFGIVMDQLTPMEIKEAEELSERLEGEGVVKLYTKEEAVLGLVKIQNNDLKRGKTAPDLSIMK